jgi:hypothetical protein
MTGGRFGFVGAPLCVRIGTASLGPRWLDARDHTGHYRLDNDSDYVRIELALALQRNIPVIQILADGAVMPAEDGLPDDLKPLARRYAFDCASKPVRAIGRRGRLTVSPSAACVAMPIQAFDPCSYGTC